MVDVVPVKNEDGLVIMFILNFEVMTEEVLKDHKRELNHRLPTWLVTGSYREHRMLIFQHQVCLFLSLDVEGVVIKEHSHELTSHSADIYLFKIIFLSDYVQG